MSDSKTPEHIVLIGPVYPYRGGISHYTGMLYRTLSKKTKVDMLTYKMQYPKLLYKKQQKDYTNDSFKVDAADYRIHTANPLNWIQTAGYIRGKKPDLVIIQWWHPYFAPCYGVLCRLLGKTQILFICHNVLPHERFPMDRSWAKFVLNKGDLFIVQSKMDEADLLSIKAGARHRVTVHPTYNAFKMKDMTKAEGRRELEIEENRMILLFFGFVRKYKGLKYLLEAMPAIAEAIPGVELLVVGAFEADKADYLQQIQTLHIGSSVKIYDDYIADAEVEKFFASCDLVVLPYETATQSGIVQIAYGFDKPVVVTRVGGLPEVVRDHETGYIVEPADPAGIAEAVISFAHEKDPEKYTRNIKAEAYRYSWDRMADTIRDLYTEGMEG